MSAAVAAAQDQGVNGVRYDVFLCLLPMFHVFGLSVITIVQLSRGNTVVVMERFEMETMMRAIERFRVSYLFVVPPVMIALAKKGRGREYDLGREVMEEVAWIFPQAEVVQVKTFLVISNF